MIVIDRRALLGTPRDASGPGWESVRMLVKSDGMGFSMTDTTVLPGAALTLHYKSHVEACYCVSGRGEVGYLRRASATRSAPAFYTRPTRMIDTKYA